MSATEHAVLVAQAKAGDANAFGELVTRHERAMFAIARAHFASDADAQDAVQEAFVKAYESLHQIEDDRRFPGWLARITANCCADILRSKTDKMSLADFATTVQLSLRLGQPSPSPSSLASRDERLAYLKAAIGRLPEDQRVVLLLRYAEDMSYEQIAAYLGVRSSTVRGRLQNAKIALRQALRVLDTPSG